MTSRVDPDLEKILPLLPLRDAATLTPKRARDELVALAESRKDVPLPELASVKDITVDGAAGPAFKAMLVPEDQPSSRTPSRSVWMLMRTSWKSLSPVATAKSSKPT